MTRRTHRMRQPWRWVPFGVRLRWASWRSWIGQHRILRRGVLAVLVAAAIASTVSMRIEAADARSKWGLADRVVVVRTDLVAGQKIAADDLRLEDWPAPLLATDALQTMPFDDVLLRDMRAGEVLTGRDLLSYQDGLHLESGHHAMNIERDAQMPPMLIGDRVDMHVFFEQFGAITESQVVSGSVVGLSAEAITVSVPAGDVGSLAQGLSLGSVVVTLASGS